MPQYELNFQDYLRIIRKRRFLIISSTILAILTAIFYTRLQLNVFQTYATVMYEEHKTVISALVESVSWTRGDPLDTEVKFIQSRIVAEGVARKLGRIKANSTKDDIDSIVSMFQAGISAEKIPNTNLIKIIVTGLKPDTVTNAANAAAEVYIEENLNRKRREARETREFIQERIATIEKELRQAEEKLKVFKEKESVTGVAIPVTNKLIDLKGRLNELLAIATENHPQVISLKAEIKDVEQQLKGLPATELEYARLSRNVEINEKSYRMLREKFEQARIVEAEKSSDVTLVNPATKPNYPITPNRRLNLILGSLTGLMLGFILAFITENLDTSIGTIEDVENIVKLPVLGIIPSVRLHEHEALEGRKKSRFINLSFKRKKNDKELGLSYISLGVQYNPHLPACEAYRMLRTNLKISPQRKTILITSTGPQEGKTTVLVSLGLIFAQMGTKVVIVDTDLRRPAVSKIFGLKREPGLTEVISGTTKLNEALRGLSDFLIGNVNFDEALKRPGLDNLNILTSGNIPFNPAELLSSVQMVSIIEELRNSFDVVLFDSPPALSISDVGILSPKLDGVILVYEMGRTARAALLRAKIQLESMGAKMLGIVLNHIQPETEIQSSYYPYYHYKDKYYYSKEDTKNSEEKNINT